MNTETQLTEIRQQIDSLCGMNAKCFQVLGTHLGELTRAINRSSEAYDQYRVSLVDLTANIISRASERDPIEPSDN